MPAEKDKAVGELLKKVLTWNVHALGPQKQDLKQVPIKFKDAREYISTFEPLLLEECRAQILRSLDSTEESCAAALARVRYLFDVDEFFVVGLAFSDESLLENFHENDLFMLCMEHPEKVFGPMEANFVPGEEGDDDKKQAKISTEGRLEDMIKNPMKYHHLIGSVEQVEQGGNKESDGRVKTMNTEIYYDRDWWVFKLCNLSTLQREYAALYTSESFPLMQTIATGDCRNDNKDTINEISAPLMDQFKLMYNPSQMKALHLALSGHKVSLIQGPPGTGKTHVIMGIMSVLLHSKKVKITREEEVKRTFAPSPLTLEQKKHAWDLAQPWMTAKHYESIRDDFTIIDNTYETTMERKRRAIKLKPNDVTPPPPKHTRRILLCAPSNGAVDEIVIRLMRHGLLNSDGVKYVPSIVRVGPGAHKDVLEVTLDSLARSKLGSSSGANPSAAGFHQTNKVQAPLDMNSARGAVLLDANIVATTLSFSGSSVLARIPGFDYVIIDEAAQAVETSTLIPLQHKCKGLILVGDPNQLPATIISKVAVDYNYDQSMFQRLMNSNNSELCLLQIQYRMHPSIRLFPSQHFYDDKLKDDDSVVTGRYQPYHVTRAFGPFVFFDLRDTFESESAAGSVCNELEASFVFELFQSLIKHFGDIVDVQNRVGIISPYRQQVLLLRSLFKDYPTVNVDTVDGYQGREKEIIIFSCVRAPRAEKNKKPSIGFLADKRRMNVGLTRPRSSLLVVGNSKALKTNPDWRAFVASAVDTHVRTKVGAVEELLNETKFNTEVDAAIAEHNAGLERRKVKEAQEASGEGQEKKKENKKRPANQKKQQQKGAGAKAAAAMEVEVTTNNDTPIVSKDTETTKDKKEDNTEASKTVVVEKDEEPRKLKRLKRGTK